MEELKESYAMKPMKLKDIVKHIAGEHGSIIDGLFKDLLYKAMDGAIDSMNNNVGWGVFINLKTTDTIIKRDQRYDKLNPDTLQVTEITKEEVDEMTLVPCHFTFKESVDEDNDEVIIWTINAGPGEWRFDKCQCL